MKDLWPIGQVFMASVLILFVLCRQMEVAPTEYVQKKVYTICFLFWNRILYYIILGEIISTQAREVQNITTSLNIQVDNPICILNQDTSRNFLSSNDPKNKFTLFMRATKLETLESEYKKIEANKRASIHIMTEKENVSFSINYNANVIVCIEF